jgi:hypothetical protein
MEGANAEAALDGSTRRMRTLSACVRKTLTYDQGKDTVHHQELRHYSATAHDPARSSRDNLTLSDREGPESWRNRK